MKKHFRKVRHYMFAYLEGIPGGSEFELLVKQLNHTVEFLNNKYHTLF